jgi:hypothetical protein
MNVEFILDRRHTATTFEPFQRLNLEVPRVWSRIEDDFQTTLVGAGLHILKLGEKLKRFAK